MALFLNLPIFAKKKFFYHGNWLKKVQHIFTQLDPFYTFGRKKLHDLYKLKKFLIYLPCMALKL